MTTAYDRVLFHGKYVTRRQKAALREVEKAIGAEFIVWQGSWRPVTPYSGTTHTGAGVCDLGLPGMALDLDYARKVTRSLRKVGCQAAFLRGPAPFGGFDWHWHVCDLDTKFMDPNAAWQVGQYRAGYDGLNAMALDPVPYRPDPVVKFNYAAWVKAQTVRARLAELTHDIARLRRRRAEALDRLESLEAH